MGKCVWGVEGGVGKCWGKMRKMFLGVGVGEM